MSTNDDRREILKLKQGIIEESETIEVDKKNEYEKPVGFAAKMSNFWYHYKLPVFFIAIVVVILSIFISDMVTKKTEDITILGLSTTSEAALEIGTKRDDIAGYFYRYCPDFDNNGYVEVSVMDVDLYQDELTNPETSMAAQTRLIGELQSGKTQLVLSDMSGIASMVSDTPVSEVLLNLAEAGFIGDTDCIVMDYFYRVKGSVFAENVGWTTCPDDMYIAIIGPYTEETHGAKRTEYYQRALAVLQNILENNVVNEVATIE